MAESTLQGENQGAVVPGENPAAGDSPKLLTQEQVNSVIGKTRAEERAKYQNYDEYKAAYEELQELKEAQQSELEKAQSRAEKAEQELAGIKQAQQVSEWRSEVAASTGVPEAALSGSTKEELEQCAESLKQFFPTGSRPFVASDGFAPQKQQGQSTREQFAEALSGF